MNPTPCFRTYGAITNTINHPKITTTITADSQLGGGLAVSEQKRHILQGSERERPQPAALTRLQCAMWPQKTSAARTDRVWEVKEAERIANTT